MSETTRPADARNPWLSWAAWRGLFRDRPIIPLVGLLGLLVVVIALVRPGMVNPEWAGVILRAAVILAILAGCQTLTMLTGGIDLSVGAVASMAGFVTATLVDSPGGLPVAIAVALASALCVTPAGSQAPAAPTVTGNARVDRLLAQMTRDLVA